MLARAVVRLLPQNGHAGLRCLLDIPSQQGKFGLSQLARSMLVAPAALVCNNKELVAGQVTLVSYYPKAQVQNELPLGAVSLKLPS